MCDEIYMVIPYHLAKKVAKYVDNSHMELSYELEIRKFVQTRQQGAHVNSVTFLQCDKVYNSLPAEFKRYLIIW